MGIAQIPQASIGSLIKSIQRGSAIAAGNVTISSVDISKTIIKSFSTASSGYVSIAGTQTSGNTGTVSFFNANESSAYASGYTGGQGADRGNMFGVNSGSATFTTSGFNIGSGTLSLNTSNLAGGSTNLVGAQNGAYLVNSTTIAVTGACRYEIVEYN
jgi:hypothetical protein